jgi:undecaprenyl-diphosphatase
VAYVAVFLLALLESLAVVGLLVPGTAGVAAAGIAAHEGKLDEWAVIAVAAAGAITGDALSYVLGRNLHAWKRLHPWFARHAEAMQRAERFVERWGMAAVILARFFGPTRAFAPMIAGTAEMPVKRYAVANVLGGIAWSFVVVTVGEEAADVYTHVPHAWFAAGVGAALAAWLVWRLVRRHAAPSARKGATPETRGIS